jgi:hypothetical protein
MSESPNTKSLEDVLRGLSTRIDDEAKGAYQAVSNIPAIKKAVDHAINNRYSEFYFAAVYPYEQMLDGLVSEVTEVEKLKFLFLHSELVELHFEKLIDRHEGSVFCSDKSSTIIYSLIRYLRTGDEIAIDYTQKVTYHLPKKVFVSHDEIVSFFDAIYSFYWGDALPYLDALARITSRINENDHTT